jgi:hypothetical protein
MPIKTHHRLDMATVQLETGLRLYYEGTDDYSVITLAGAADTIFGQALRAAGKEPRLETIKKAAAQIYERSTGRKMDPRYVPLRANLARNALKHWDPDQPLSVDFDARREASDMLDRAVSNYFSLTNTASLAMERFLIERYDNDGEDDIVEPLPDSTTMRAQDE